jgi:beta-galactosidase
MKYGTSSHLLLRQAYRYVMAGLVLVNISAAATDTISLRERISLNVGWRFTKDDPAGVGDKLNYANIKDWILPTGAVLTKDRTLAANQPAPGNPSDDIAYAQGDFDDSRWRLLNLPHDWGIEGPFKQEYPGETGKLAWWGVGWYRKHLTIPAVDEGRKIYLDVDGAMSYATVWLNGQFVGGWPYGYASWRVDLTPFVRFGLDNVLAIRLDNPKESSRWYPGGGIYRNVWLVKTAPVHVAHWGTYVTTPEVSNQSASVKVLVNVDNDTDTESAVTVKNEVFELKTDGSKGKSVATLANAGQKIAAHQSIPTEGQIVLKDPKVWSIERSQRYVAVTSIEQGGRCVDRYETPFGIRTIQFTANNGFLLNGKRVPLNGVCDHHDLGALGTAINTRALERQVEILKQMGCKAIRTSHNPPAPELLDMCDRLGMVVMDEAFDCC